MSTAQRNAMRSEGEAISTVRSGLADPFDRDFEELMKGPAGAQLRRAHLLEQLTTRVFDGDSEKAEAALETPHPLLEGRSASQAATTHDGMLEVKQILEKSAPVAFSQRGRSIGALIQAINEGTRKEYEPLLDLLRAAWGLNAQQFTMVLGSVPPSPIDWQKRRVSLSNALISRLARLRRLHEAFRAMVSPENYRDIWHSTWEHGSLVGNRSLWQAYEEDGDRILDEVEAYFLGLEGPF